jgi:hypothetical protein
MSSRWLYIYIADIIDIHTQLGINTGIHILVSESMNKNAINIYR